MAIWRLLVGRGTPRQLRLMAGLNVAACAFVTAMTLLTSGLGFFLTVPAIFRQHEQAVFLHRCAIGYLFVNVCGNFILCICTDTGTAKRTPRTAARHRKVSARPTTAVETKSSDTRSRESVLGEVASKEADIGKQENSATMPAGKLPEKRSQKGLVVSSESSDLVFSQDHESRSILNESLIDNKHKLSTPSVSGKPSSDVRNVSAKIQLSKRASASPNTDPQHASDAEAVKSSTRKRQELDGSEEPERSHWCKLCEKRILRRDHHCFFMTVCIGYRNHKHFIFFCLYMMVGALYSVILAVRFLHVLYGVRFHGPQTFVLLLVRVMHNVCVRGVVPPPLFALMLFELYLSLAVGLTAAGFLYWHLAITVHGQTTHEASRGDVRYRRRLRHNVSDVLGLYWPLLFILPLPLPQAGDGRSYTASTTTTPNNTNNNNNTPATNTPSSKDNHHQRHDCKEEGGGRGGVGTARERRRPGKRRVRKT